MEFLKEFLGDELYSQVEAKLKGNDKVKLANLASGEYVSKGKYDDKVDELDKANVTITSLNETVSKFDGANIEELQTQIADGKKKYDDDTKALKDNIKKRDAVDAWLDAHPSKHRGLMRSQFNYDKLSLDGDKVSGIEEIGNGLLESYSDMFSSESQGGNEGGSQGGNGGMEHGKSPKEKKPEEMTMEEYAEWRSKQK